MFRKLYNADGEGASESAPKTDLNIQYLLRKDIQELGYGTQFGERTIQVIKTEYAIVPNAITNESSKQQIKAAYVIDSLNETIDFKQNYLDKLDDSIFKTLAEAHVIVLDPAAELRYVKVLAAITNTTPLKAKK